MPSAEEFLNHARRYNTEGIAETAAEDGFSVEELASLIEGLDKIHAEQLKRLSRYNTPKKHRLSYVDRAKRLLGIEDDTCSPDDVSLT